MGWKFLVERKLSLLFDEFITQGQIKKVMKEKLGANFGFDNYRAIEWKVAYIIEEIEEANEIVKEAYLKQGSGFLKSLIDKWELFINDLEKISLGISKKDYSSASDKKLIDELNKLKRAYKNISTALYAPIVIEDLSDEIIKKGIRLYNPGKVGEYFNVLTTSEKENEGTKELRSMLKMAIKLKKGKDIVTDVKKHIKEFGWINTRGFFGEAWSEEEIFERINSMLKENLINRLNELDKYAEKVKKDTKEVLSEIKADKGFRDFIDITKKYVYFRTHRMDVFVKYGFLARPLFKGIARRINLDLEELWYLFSNEIEQAIIDKKDFSKVIEARRKGFGFIRSQEKVVALTGKELEKYKEEHMKEQINKDITE